AAAHAAAGRANGDTVPGAPTQAQAVVIARARHPELFAAHTRGTTYVAVRTDERGRVTSSATAATMGGALRGEDGSRVGPTYSATITRVAIPAAEGGPDSLVVVWTHALSAAELARQHAASQRSTDQTIAAVDRYFPGFRATGEPAAMYFVVSSTGEVLRSGVAPAAGPVGGGTPGHLPDVPPTSIERVSLHKGNAMVIGGHPAQVIWIVLKPGAQPPAR
ncbi:MAG: hypothetical protein JWM27_1297, partial [Gemmatimonadetes bacterium]|nr:hypothetical protein [Gemmatimonadota bacterium]